MHNATGREKRKTGIVGLPLIAALGLVFHRQFREFFAAGRHTVMESVKAKLERQLAVGLGARVECGYLDVTPTGRLEIRDFVATAEDAARPFLRVGRLSGKVDLPLALLGDVRITSAVLERPVLELRRLADGRLNLPRAVRPASAAEAKETADDAVGGAQTAKQVVQTMGRMGLQLHVDHALCLDAEFHYVDEALGGYHLAAERVLGEVRRADGDYDLLGIIAALGRRDRPVELGEVRLVGALTDVDNLLRVDDFAGLHAELAVGDGLAARVECETLRPPRVRVRVAGDAELTSLTPILPDGVPALEPLRTATTQGRVTLSIQAAYRPDDGLCVNEINVSARDVGVGGETAAATAGV